MTNGTYSEEILARYKQSETEQDKFGRAITVRRLRPSQELGVLRFADSDDVALRSIMIVAASVRQIDVDMIPPAQSLKDINSLMDRLDQEGMQAASKAYARLMGAVETEGEDEAAAPTTMEANVKN